MEIIFGFLIIIGAIVFFQLLRTNNFDQPVSSWSDDELARRLPPLKKTLLANGPKHMMKLPKSVKLLKQPERNWQKHSCDWKLCPGLSLI